MFGRFDVECERGRSDVWQRVGNGPKWHSEGGFAMCKGADGIEDSESIG